MIKRHVWAVFSVCILVTGAAAQPSGDEGLLHRRELVRRYMSAIHLDEQMKNITTTLLPMMMEDAQKQYPDVPDAMIAALKSSASGALDDFLPKLENRYAELMAAKFSADELEQVASFYESPVGQKIVAKTGEMTSSIQPIVRELIPDLQADMLRRLCAKIDCSTLPKPARA